MEKVLMVLKQNDIEYDLEAHSYFVRVIVAQYGISFSIFYTEKKGYIYCDLNSKRIAKSKLIDAITPYINEIKEQKEIDKQYNARIEKQRKGIIELQLRDLHLNWLEKMPKPKQVSNQPKENEVKPKTVKQIEQDTKDDLYIRFKETQQAHRLRMIQYNQEKKSEQYIKSKGKAKKPNRVNPFDYVDKNAYNGCKNNMEHISKHNKEFREIWNRTKNHNVNYVSKFLWFNPNITPYMN